jgi:hypothetical protein
MISHHGFLAQYEVDSDSYQNRLLYHDGHAPVLSQAGIMSPINTSPVEIYQKLVYGKIGPVNLPQNTFLTVLPVWNMSLCLPDTDMTLHRVWQVLLADPQLGVWRTRTSQRGCEAHYIVNRQAALCGHSAKGMHYEEAAEPAAVLHARCSACAQMARQWHLAIQENAQVQELILDDATAGMVDL